MLKFKLRPFSVDDLINEKLLELFLSYKNKINK